VTWLDVAVTVTICLLAAFGFWKGIVRAVIGIAGLLGGILVAGSLHRQVAAMLWPSGGTWSLIAAYAVVLIATLVVAALLAALVSRLIHMTALGMVDRIVGLAVGAIVATMGWALLLALLVPLSPGFADLVSQSPVARLLLYWSLAVNGIATDPGYTVSVRPGSARDSLLLPPLLSFAERRIQYLLEFFLWLEANHLLHRLPVLEDEHGWDCSYAVLRGYRAVVLNIDLGEGHFAIIFLRKLFHYRGRSQTGSTPLRPEIHENRSLRLQHGSLKVLFTAYGLYHVK